MGQFILLRNPEETILNLIVPERYFPQLVSYMERTGCIYDQEVRIGENDKERKILLKNIHSPRAGRGIGDLIGLFYGLEFQGLLENREDRFYIVLTTKKERKKYVRKNREKAGAGSQGGNSGKPSGDIQPGKDRGPGGRADCAGDVNPESPYWEERP